MEAGTTTLTAILDLAVCPVSFDSVVFLQKARVEAARIGADRMHVCIVGQIRHKPQYDEHEARWRLWNIVIPACGLMGATFSLAADWLQVKRMLSEKDWKTWPADYDKQTLKDRRHLIGDLITWAKAGDTIPLLSASTHARRKVKESFRLFGRPVVTMTLRNTYLRERNTHKGEWFRAKQFIENAGYAVVVMEDTDVALTQGHGFGELNLDLRMACYQEAALNLQANNGAASLCWFSAEPYRMFGCGVPPDEWNGLFVEQGLPIGETWPWARPQQKLVYGAPVAEQIIEEFEAWASATS